MIDELPQGWTGAPLRDVVAARKGKKPKVLHEVAARGRLPYLLIDQMEGKPARYFTDDPKVTVASKDDVLVVWDGSIGKCVAGLEGAVGSTIMALKPLGVESGFLEAFIKHARQTLLETSRGTGLQHINQQVFWELEFPLAPFAEQQRILLKVEKLLAKADACQQRLAKIPILLKRFRQSVLATACRGQLTIDWRAKRPQKPVRSEVQEVAVKQWAEYRAECERARQDGRRKPRIPICLDEDLKFDLPEDFPELPESWSYFPLGRLASNEADSFVDGPFGTAVNTKTDYIDTGVPVVRINNVRPFQFVNENLKYVSPAKFKELSRHKISSGDILLAKVGATIGDCCIYPKDLPTALLSTTGSCRLTVERRLVDNRFLCAQLNLLKPHLQWIASAVAQPFLNMAAVRTLPLALPPLAEQQEIVRRVDALFALANQIEARYAKAKAYVEKLTQSILAKAFRGELVPQDPNDEPASVLLERIKNARSDSSQEGKNRRSNRSNACATS